jgi:hypothetical protein
MFGVPSNLKNQVRWLLRGRRKVGWEKFLHPHFDYYRPVKSIDPMKIGFDLLVDIRMQWRSIAHGSEAIILSAPRSHMCNDLGMKVEPFTSTFVYVPCSEGEILLNLNQIAWAIAGNKEELVLKMANGESVTVHGAEGVDKLVGLLGVRTMNLDGVSMVEKITKDAESQPVR